MKDNIEGGLKDQVKASGVVARDKQVTELLCTLGQQTLKADVREMTTKDN